MKKKLLLCLIGLMVSGMYGCKKEKPKWSQAIQQNGSYIAKCAQRASKEELDLLKAIFDADQDQVKKIITQEKVDVNSLADGKTTFLHAIADSGTFEGNDPDTMDNIVSELIGVGADVNKVDQDGQTPLAFSARIKNTDFGKCMIKKGADGTIADHRGKTVLHYAANSDCPWRWELVEKLLPKKTVNSVAIAVNTVDNNRKTALDYAIANVEGPDRKKIIERLQSKGATTSSS